ncbi:MAG: aminoglycoside phosphotransferase family protein [Chlamydiales bacterium]
MDNFITLYQERLNLEDSLFSRIDHDDAMVAVVYKVTLPNGTEFILKTCSRTNYLREIYFLQHFAGKLPVPRIINVVPPEIDLHGAILMEYLPGTLLKMTDFTDQLAFEMGSLLARIHLNRCTGYGDLIQPEDLKSDPRFHFTLKFQEGIDECSDHLPQPLIEQCRLYYDRNLNLLNSVDGPCIIHRDFRAGNVIIDNGKIRGIIDWSSGRASFAEDDFCPMEHGEWPSHPTSKKAFLSGYASIRPVPDYSAVMPFLRLNRAIATVGFTVKRGTWDNSNARVYQFNRRFLESFFNNH